MQANFLKAAQMDDPVEREKAMTRLQSLQVQANKGQNLEEIEALAHDLPYAKTGDPSTALMSAKNEANAKEEMSKT